MKALFPYRTLFGDVTADIVEIAIDDVGVSGRVDIDERRIALQGVGRASWDTVRLTVSVAGPAGELAEADNAVAVAVANCGPSNTRVSTVLEPDGATPGRWTGELSLDRHLWFGQAELRCGIVATVDGEDNRIIGWADTWTIGFDDLPNRPVIGGAIKITWLDFNNPGDDRTHLRRHTDKYLYLSIDPHEPQLFLNRGFDGLEALLVDRPNRRGADRALHDQTRASIADKTWSALFNTAIDSVEVDGDNNPEWPEIPWQQVVLRSLLDQMYRDQSPDTALANAYEARRSPDAAGSLQERLAPAASAQARAPRLLRDGIRRLSHELATNDEETDQ